MAAAEQKALSEADLNFIQTLHDGQDVLFRQWMNLLDGKGKQTQRLIIISKLRFTIGKTTMFGGRAVQSEDLHCNLKVLKVRGLNQAYTIEIKSDALGEVCIIPPDDVICEHVTLTLLNCFQRFRSACVVPNMDVQEDIPEEFREKFEKKLMTNIEKCLFAYKYYCAEGKTFPVPAVLQNLPVIFQSGDNGFSLNKAINGANAQPNQFLPLIKSLFRVTSFNKFEANEVNVGGKNQAELIGQLVSYNKTFDHLQLTDCRLNKASLKVLLEPLADSNLRTLNIGFNPIKDAGITQNKNLLSRLEINSLYLNNCEFRDNGMDQIAMILRSSRWNREDPDGLTRLNLAGNKFGKKGTAHLASFIADEALCLRELSLVKCNIDISPVIDALITNKNLAKKMRTLNFSHNRITQPAGEKLGDLLSWVENLKQLMLCSCHLDKNNLEPIIGALCRNREGIQTDLHLSNNTLTGYFADIMKNVEWKPVLSGLILEECELHVDDVIKISEVLVEHNKTIKWLSLDLNLKTNKKMDNLPAMAAVAGVINNCDLEILHLGGEKPNRKLSITGAELRPVLESLGQSNKLTNLYLQGNRIAMDGIHYLDVSLATNSTLMVINLEDNKLTFEMAMQILSLAKPGALTNIIPINSMKILKGKLRRDELPQLQKAYRTAKIILNENRERAIRSRHKRGADLNCEIIGGDKNKEISLNLPFDVKNKRMSSKLFSDSLLSTEEVCGILDGEDEGIEMDEARKNALLNSRQSMKPTQQFRDFRVMRRTGIKDAQGKEKGKLQEGAVVQAELGTKKQVRKRSIKTEEIFEIYVKTPHVSGWVQMNTYKGEPILQIADAERSSELFSGEVLLMLNDDISGGSDMQIMEEIIELACPSRPVGVAMKIVENEIVVQEVEPGTVASEQEIQPGDILCSVNGELVKSPKETLMGFAKLQTPFLLSFSRRTMQAAAQPSRPIRKSLAHGKRRKVKAPPRTPTSKEAGGTPGGFNFVKLAEEEDDAFIDDFDDEPGTWRCDMCHSKNKLGRVACEMCDTPKKSAPPVSPNKEEESDENTVVVESERQKLKRLPEESEKNLRFENEEAENVEEKRAVKPVAVTIGEGENKEETEKAKEEEKKEELESKKAAVVEPKKEAEKPKVAEEEPKPKVKEDLKAKPDVKEDVTKEEKPKEEAEIIPEKKEEPKKVEKVVAEANEKSKQMVEEKPKKKKVGNKLGDIMAKLNQQKGSDKIASAPKKPRKKINTDFMKNMPMPGSKPPSGGTKKKVGKLNTNLMKGMQMPIMGGMHPKLKKKAQENAGKMPDATATLEKATIQGKRKKRKRKKVVFSDL